VGVGTGLSPKAGSTVIPHASQQSNGQAVVII